MIPLHVLSVCDVIDCKELTPMYARFIIAALYGSILLAQTPAERVVHITHSESDQQLQDDSAGNIQNTKP